MAKDLKNATIDSAKYSREFLARRRNDPISFDPLLKTPPLFFPGFLVTDTVSAAGGAFWPYAYRPDRVCRQFGLDQPPRSIDIAFTDVNEAMKAVLFKANDALPAFDASKFVPSTQVGRVLDIWVAYHARLRTSVKRYEKVASQRAFPNVPIMSSKVASLESVPDTPIRKQGTTRSPKPKKELALPTMALERLKAKPSPKDLPPTSLSNPLVIPNVAGPFEGDQRATKSLSHVATEGSSVDKVFNEEETNSFISAHASSPILKEKLIEENSHVNPSLKGVPSAAKLDVPEDATTRAANVTSPQGNNASYSTRGFFKGHAADLSVEIVPILGSLLSDEDAKVLNHTIALLGAHKEKVMNDLKALSSLFGFKGLGLMSFPNVWIVIFLLQALEDLDKIREAAMNQEKRNVDLKAQIERLNLELTRGELELERLSAKRREIEDARAGLDVLLNI
ncbi:hypothetical protein SESBI_30425 [Sesbania bispinosa]|nr:hypothetical protein SESBI_30425 [Sesbania bispinosa]